jgi:protein-tyrosine phosphatase
MVSIHDLPNGRDLGGTLGRGGAVRHGLLFRSAAPAGDAARAALAELGVRTVVDLRSAMEREQQPTDVPPTAVVHGADVLADASYAGAANLGQLAAEALSGHEIADGFSGRDLRAIMLQSYRDFAELGSGKRAGAELVHLLADPHSGPVLIHCTAGKDRTGWLVAVVLHILGVPWEAITEDYLRSGPEVRAMFSGLLQRLPDGAAAGVLLAPVLGVFPEYLEAAKRQAELEHGSLDRYIRDGLGIDDDVADGLRGRLLPPR